MHGIYFCSPNLDMYSAIPAEFKEKLMKDFISNPNKVGQDMLNLVGPQFQNVVSGLLDNLAKSLEFLFQITFFL